MSVPFTPATTIDEVLQRLDAIINYSIEKESAIGLFAALYIVVTEKIKEGIDAKNVFEDNQRMERLDVIFANRYLKAFHQYTNGETPTKTWQLAFNATERFSSYIILQELLAGMNAHVNLDLGIATAETAPGDLIDGLHTDFLAVNAILSKLTNQVQGEINELSPRVGLIDKWLKGVDDVVLNFSLKKARDFSWKFAKKLAPLPPEEWDAAIEEHEKGTIKFGEAVLSPGLIGTLVVWWIKRKESKSLPEIINGLRQAANVVAARMA